ncbi:MAG: hypothetical protein HY898_24220 [Deltaproteobacteria bacterium]|nr:hypothetical protein [Deltaproteobacteria bacterium]
MRFSTSFLLVLCVLPVSVGLASCEAKDSAPEAQAGAGGEDGGQEASDDVGTSTQEGGDSETGASGEGGPTCDPATQPGTAECATCVDALSKASCQKESDACVASPDCLAIRSCAMACASFQCLYECIDKNKAAESLFIAWRGCVDTGCHDACHCTECRLFPSTPCHECMNLKCTPQCLGCDKSAACMGAMYCRYFHCAEPESQACIDECTQAYPGSEAPFLALLGPGGCISTQCPTECSKQ